jgi:nickel transport system substrate-binding protein
VSDNTYATRNLLLNTASGKLGDLRVRQAIEHGIHKQEVVDTVLHGVEQMADVLFSNKLPYCDLDLTAYDHDPALAGSLLDQAGWTEKNARGIRTKDGAATLTLQAIYMSDRSTDQQILMAFKGQMAELGIGVEIQGYEAMTWYEKGMAGEFDITVNDTYGFPQDPHVFVAAMINYGVDNPAQQGLVQKPEIDRRVKDLLATVDEARLRQDYTYILRTLQEEAVNVPVSYLKEMVVFNSEKIKSLSFNDNAIFIDIGSFVLH